MGLIRDDFLLDVWSVRKDGVIVYPYKGKIGNKRGKFSVNLTNDNKNFKPYSEKELIALIESGAFAKRGSIRMLPLKNSPGDQRNAYHPKYFKGHRIRK
jgi:hypothetical protein